MTLQYVQCSVRVFRDASPRSANSAKYMLPQSDTARKSFYFPLYSISIDFFDTPDYNRKNRLLSGFTLQNMRVADWSMYTLMKTHESGENYLETILLLREKNSEVRSIDIANEMGFSRPSISRAMKVLKNDQCIDMDGSGRITLTAKGEAIAGQIYARHTLLTQFFKFLGVNEKTAADDACRMEHVLSEQTFIKLTEHFEKTLRENGQP